MKPEIVYKLKVKFSLRHAMKAKKGVCL